MMLTTVFGFCRKLVQITFFYNWILFHASCGGHCNKWKENSHQFSYWFSEASCLKKRQNQADELDFASLSCKFAFRHWNVWLHYFIIVTVFSAFSFENAACFLQYVGGGGSGNGHSFVLQMLYKQQCSHTDCVHWNHTCWCLRTEHCKLCTIPETSIITVVNWAQCRFRFHLLYRFLLAKWPPPQTHWYLFKGKSLKAWWTQYCITCPVNLCY